MENVDEWHKIGNKLTKYLGICNCQRKLKSIVTILLSIRDKIQNSEWDKLTMEELLICALLEHRDVITHGTNCEYPFIGESPVWDWLDTIKDSPYLEDN